MPNAAEPEPEPSHQEMDADGDWPMDIDDESEAEDFYDEAVARDIHTATTCGAAMVWKEKERRKRGEREEKERS